MSFFGFGRKMLKSTIQSVVLPVEVCRDIVTLGGIATDQPETYTTQRLKKAADDFEEGLDELDE